MEWKEVGGQKTNGRFYYHNIYTKHLLIPAANAHDVNETGRDGGVEVEENTTELSKGNFLIYDGGFHRLWPTQNVTCVVYVYLDAAIQVPTPCSQRGGPFPLLFLPLFANGERGGWPAQSGEPRRRDRRHPPQRGVCPGRWICIRVPGDAWDDFIPALCLVLEGTRGI
ncbi:hypothetical protein LY78DRAFT_39374 [Colletotrichum sublineola]|nr:hypothetical protein LY78DRAFT_39374 [Colletotrichum sublineola]